MARFFLAQAGTLSLHFDQAFLWIAHMSLTQPLRSDVVPTSTARIHTYYLFIKDGKVVGLGRPIIAVVQPAQSIMGKYATRSYAASSAPRPSLAQSQMCAVLVMVRDVLGKQPLPAASRFKMGRATFFLPGFFRGIFASWSIVLRGPGSES